MVLCKSVLTGLVIASICLADISGIVTDTGTTPLSGVVVKLEKGKQFDTTGSDGRFTLVTNTAVVSKTGAPLPRHISATISNKVMTITLAEKSAMEVTAFSLDGTALSTVSSASIAEKHSITLPFQGIGIFLFKIKTVTREFLLKGTTIGGVALLCTANSFNGSAPVCLPKKSSCPCPMDDIISANKTGYLNYRCVQYSSDTAGVVIKMVKNAGDLVDVDGNVYQTVQIGNQIWMAENLRVTKYRDGSRIALDTSAASWRTIKDAKYCFYKNTTNPDSIRKFGALYNWYVLNPANSNKIAPAGWHVPSEFEWSMTRRQPPDGYPSSDYAFEKSLAAKADWELQLFPGMIGNDLAANNSTGFSAYPVGNRDCDGSFRGGYGMWWTTAFSAATNNPTISHLVDYPVYKDYREAPFCDGCSIRLLKDQEEINEWSFYGNWKANDTSDGFDSWTFNLSDSRYYYTPPGENPYGREESAIYATWAVKGGAVFLYNRDRSVTDTLTFKLIEEDMMRFAYTRKPAGGKVNKIFKRTRFD